MLDFLDHDKDFKYFFIPLNIIVLFMYFLGGTGHFDSFGQILLIPFKIIFIPLILLLIFVLTFACLGLLIILVLAWILYTYEDQDTSEFIENNERTFGGFLFRIAYVIFIFAWSYYFFEGNSISDFWDFVSNTF